MADDTTTPEVQATDDATNPEAKTDTDQIATPKDGDLPPEVRAILKKERSAARAAEARAKAAEAKVTEFEAAGKTEMERLTDRAAQAEQAAKDATMQLARERVARRVGLPEKFIDRLRGDTEEELEDDATSLLEDLPAREGPATPPVRDGETPNPAANVAPGAPRLEAAYAQAAKTART
ncbi:MAG: hypothetical protein KDC33_10810 [Thermoleophilia bacterium]|nr:hypothetical protein [Thermoleophilia bacterium]